MRPAAHPFRPLVLIAICGACGGTQPDRSATTAADAGLRLWSAFECSSYAEMAGNAPEQRRLLQLGMDTGRPFVNGVRNRTIAASEIGDRVPVAVLTAMAGPTTDFMLGRIYATAAQQAFDRVAKENSIGILQPANEWVLDKKVHAINAGTRYDAMGCARLQ